MHQSLINVQVDSIKLEILRIAERTNCDTSILVTAMAEVLAVTAAVLDRHEKHNITPINDRLDTFVAHVRKRYMDVRSSIAANDDAMAGKVGNNVGVVKIG